MKIICIGRNYAEHAKELNNETPEEPVVFLKPDTALIKSGDTFYLPDFSNNVQHEIELVLKICKAGKHIEPEFAGNYYKEISVGIDFTARDLQQELKSKGLPWEKAKGFDCSAVVGQFVTLSELSNPIEFSLEVNGELRQHGISSDMIFDFNQIVSHISKYYTLKVGDLIYTGTPAGVSAVKANDQLVGKLNGQELFSVDVK